MSDTVQLALIASIAPTMAALAALVVGVRNSRKSSKLIEKTAEIHALANSNLDKVSTSLEVANERIQGLQKLISTIAETKTKEPDKS